ncbi:TonB-dependent receptor [bacterium SCSIO 12741]|nr:TonB-dependent receptor [bacterium SCSIO 12741]
MKYLFLYFLLFWVVSPVFSQTVISGSVTDSESGEPLPFTHVYNVRTQHKTTTGSLGDFSLEAQVGSDTLVISFLGYETQRILATQSVSVVLEPAALKLNDVIVSANREEEKRTDMPIAISSISAKTIDDNKPTSIDQVLNQTPGVYMVDLGNEQHTMSIRRPIDYGASYLYLEDGVPIRASGVFNHNALLEINMANVRKVEIIRGPSSSMYGSEAIGGSVNFISKRASLRPTARVQIQGNSIGYKRADFTASNTFKKKLGIRLSGYYADQKDGVISHSDFHKLALSLNTNYRISKSSEIQWNQSFIDYYADMSGSLDSSDFYSKTYSSNQTFTNRKVRAYRSTLSLKHYWKDNSKSTVTGYYRNNSIKQNPSYRVRDDYKPWIPSGQPGLAHGEVNENKFSSYGLIAQHKKGFDFLNSSLVVGSSIDYSPNAYQAEYIRIHKEDGNYTSFDETDSLLADYLADLTNFAAYAQLKVEPVKNLQVTGALRYDFFNYSFDNHLGSNAFTSVLDGQNTFAQLTPKLGLTYNWTKYLGTYANYGRGFVPPQVTELYRGNEVPALKPVHYNNYELGGWLTFARQRGKLELSLYQMDGINEIISVLQDDGSRIRQNAGKTSHQGIEYGLTVFPIKDLAVRFSGTVARHEFVDFKESGTDFSGNRIPQSPEWIANSQVSYAPSYFPGFRISLEWQHVSPYFMDQANTKTYEGYDVFNLRTGYTWKGIEVWAHVMNLTDELYATVARANQWGQSYSLGKPRFFTLGLSYSFKSKKS